MKTLKRLQSIILAAVMCFSCMAVLAATSVTAEEAPANDKSYVIWEARPDLNSSDQAYRAESGQSTAPNNTAVAVWDNNIDNSEKYYRITLTDNKSGLGWQEGGAIVKSNVNYDYNDKNLGWLSSSGFISAILPYVTFKADVRVMLPDGGKPTVNIGFYTIYSPEKTDYLKLKCDAPIDAWKEVEFKYTAQDAVENNLGGYFYVYAQDNYSDRRVIVDIKNLRMEVKASQKQDLNNAVKNVWGTCDKGRWDWHIQFTEESDFFASIIKFDSEAQNKPVEKSYVIWEANPELVRDINTGAKSGDGKIIELLAGGGLGASRAELKSEGNCYYYSLFALENSNYAKNGIFLKTDFVRPDGKDTVGENFEELAYALGWVRFGEYIDLIAPYLTLKCDIRCTSEGGKDGPLKIGIAKDGNTDNVIEYINLSSKNIVYSNTGNWVSIEGDYKSGAIKNVYGERLTFYVNAWGYDFDIKNLRLEIKEKDRLTVNNLVKDLKDPWARNSAGERTTPITDVGHDAWIQGWTRDSNGNVDFFAKMITFDSKLSKSSLNVLRGDLNKDGKRDICDLVALNNYVASLSTEAPLPYKNINIVDCDRDGKVDNSDLSPLRKALLEK